MLSLAWVKNSIFRLVQVTKLCRALNPTTALCKSNHTPLWWGHHPHNPQDIDSDLKIPSASNRTWRHWLLTLSNITLLFLFWRHCCADVMALFQACSRQGRWCTWQRRHRTCFSLSSSSAESLCQVRSTESSTTSYPTSQNSSTSG